MPKAPETLWKVEDLVDYRESGGRREYLVKWRGWGEEDNSWEPAAHLTHDMRRLAEHRWPIPSSSSSSSTRIGRSSYTAPRMHPANNRPVISSTSSPSSVRSTTSSSSGSAGGKKGASKATTVKKQESPGRGKRSSDNMTGKEDGGSQNSTVKKRIIRKSVKPCDEMRQDNLTWDEYFMGIARLSAERSKDPVTRSGACIVDPDNRIVGIGYNGMPIGCPDHQLPWKMESDNIVDRKETYACHAEINAILNKNSGNLKGCTMFTDSFPCNECAKAIIQSGIGQVVYLRDRNPGDPVSIASRKLLTMAGIGIRLFESKRNPITISLQPADPAE